MKKEQRQFYICDLRREFSRSPYITFWRPNNSNYAFPLVWAGKYDRAVIVARPSYYLVVEDKTPVRFPVPCDVVDMMGVQPEPGTIDGDAGPVVLNTKSNRAFLRAALWVPHFAHSFKPRRKAVKR